MLHADNKEIIAATAGVVAENSVAITKVFYPKMFGNNPELLNVFNSANQAVGEQPIALASSIVAYARHLLGADDIPFERVIERIAQKHVSLGIAPGDYAIVGRNLMEAIGEVLGEAVTPEVARAWGEVYWLFAMDLVAAEASIYTQQGVTPETLLRDHKLTAREETAPGVWTYRFAPTDGEAVPQYLPGQYVTIVGTVADGRTQPRQYTLSDAHNPAELQITVKQAKGTENAPEGLISNMLANAEVGSVWPISTPCGDVHVSAGEEPLVLVSAGVGITPMAAILATVAQDQPHRSVRHIHFDASETAMPLREQTAASIEKLDNGTQELVFGQHSVDALRELEIEDGTHAFLCGSVPFMRDARHELIELGVNSDNISYEVFGPDLWLGGSEASQAPIDA